MGSKRPGLAEVLCPSALLLRGVITSANASKARLQIWETAKVVLEGGGANLPALALKNPLLLCA